MKPVALLYLGFCSAALAQQDSNAAAESAKRRIAKMELFASRPLRPLIMIRPSAACVIPLTSALKPEAGASRTPIMRTPPGRPGDVMSPMPACDEAVVQNK
jgi:hypothetical protein